MKILKKILPRILLKIHLTWMTFHFSVVLITQLAYDDTFFGEGGDGWSLESTRNYSFLGFVNISASFPQN